MKVQWMMARTGMLLGLLLLGSTNIGIEAGAASVPQQAMSIAAAVPTAGVTKAAGFTDMTNHWAQEAVAWGVSQSIVNGYDDGGFHPDQKVTEAEFLAMLLRAFPVTNTGYAESLTPWYGAYFTYAAGQNWPVEPALANEPYLRGEAARLIAATQGQQLEMDKSIEYLLRHELAQGKTASTVDGFGKNDTLTRAESLQFIRNLVSKQLTLSMAPAISHKIAPFSLRGVVIGDFESAVISKLGQPQRKDASEYAFQWYVYNTDYSNYVQVGIKDGQVVALFSNAANWNTDKGIQSGSTHAALVAAYGEPMTYMLKGNTRLSLSNIEQVPTYEWDGNYVTFFNDLHEDSRVTAMQVIRKDVENTKPGFYGAPSEELRMAYEKELLDLANVVRVRSGKRAFTWDEKIAGTARKHSKDMADNDYFDHTNPAGKDPFARMRDDQIPYGRAAENIAAGQTSAIFAHSGWMNSFDGHREAILGDTLRLGVGVYFGGSMKIYYTQNFYTPR